MRIGFTLIVALLPLLSWNVLTAFAADGNALRLYVGTYTSPKNGSKGIYRVDLDAHSGRLGAPEVAGEVKSPSFLAIHPSSKFLYAVGELSTFQGKPSGAVSALAIDAKTGALRLLNQQPSGGSGPCYVSLDAKGRVALIANYGSGSVASLPIGDDGRLGEPASAIQHEGSGPNEKRQTGPHAHAFHLDGAGRFALAPDLGIDQVRVYRLDLATAKLTSNDPPAIKAPPGFGPRHLAFHPSGKFVYVAGELQSAVAVYAYDVERGAAKEVQTITMLPEKLDIDRAINTAADIRVHPSGKFLYASNRGHDSIAIFAIDASTGRLTARGHASTQGKTPRNFNIDPSGQWLIAANQNSDTLVVFRIDPDTGALTPTGSTATIPSPVCVQFWKEAN